MGCPGQNRSGHYRVMPGSAPLYRLDLFNVFAFVLWKVVDYYYYYYFLLQLGFHPGAAVSHQYRHHNTITHTDTEQHKLQYTYWQFTQTIQCAHTNTLYLRKYNIPTQLQYTHSNTIYLHKYHIPTHYKILTQIRYTHKIQYTHPNTIYLHNYNRNIGMVWTYKTKKESPNMGRREYEESLRRDI
jgi:hypothetical protein